VETAGDKNCDSRKSIRGKDWRVRRKERQDVGTYKAQVSQVLKKNCRCVK